MSTFFHFACENCKAQGGMLSRQAWGYGNFDIIASFKFLAYHIDHCGHEYVRMVMEQDSGYTDSIVEGREAVQAFLDDTRRYFPRSDDWKIVSDMGHDPDLAEFEWRKRELENM